MTSFKQKVLTTSAIALGLIGLAATTNASPPPSEGVPTEQTSRKGHHEGAERHGRHGRGFFNLRGIKSELKLSAAQEKMWQAAEELQKATREARKGQERPNQLWQNALKSDTFNPRTVAEKIDTLRKKGESEQHKVREAWLSVYESLDNAQKQIVLQHWRTVSEKMQERRGQRHHGEYKQG